MTQRNYLKYVDICVNFSFRISDGGASGRQQRDVIRLTCIASDVRYRVRSRGQNNVINISIGSGVRRVIIRRQQYSSKHLKS